MYSGYYNTTTSGLLYSAITFPDLTVTQFTPGEEITIVSSDREDALTTTTRLGLIPPLEILTRTFRRLATSNLIRIFVPSDAITGTAPSISNTVSETTTNTVVTNTNTNALTIVTSTYTAGGTTPTAYGFIPSSEGNTGAAVTTTSHSGAPSKQIEFGPIWCCLLVVLFTGMSRMLG